jgi:hypothetical protein
VLLAIAIAAAGAFVFKMYTTKTGENRFPPADSAPAHRLLFDLPPPLPGVPPDRFFAHRVR